MLPGCRSSGTLVAGLSAARGPGTVTADPDSEGVDSVSTTSPTVGIVIVPSQGPVEGQQVSDSHRPCRGLRRPRLRACDHAREGRSSSQVLPRAGAVGAIDETSQVKQGTATVGVKRQYLG